MTTTAPANLGDPVTDFSIWFDPSKLGRSDLMRASSNRGLPHTLPTVQLVTQLQQWLDANGLRQPAPVEVDDDPDDGWPDDLDENPPKAPAAGVTSASTPAAGGPVAPARDADTVTVDRAEWERMQQAVTRLLAGQQGAVAKPLDNPTVATTPITAPGRSAKTGLFPGGYRAEHYIGPRGIDDELHFALIEATHAEARDAGYRTKGAPLAGLRIGFSLDDRGRTAIYEVAIHKE